MKKVIVFISLVCFAGTVNAQQSIATGPGPQDIISGLGSMINACTVRESQSAVQIVYLQNQIAELQRKVQALEKPAAAEQTKP